MRNMPIVKPRPKRPQNRKTFIRQWRQYRGLSQDRLVDRLGVDPENPELPFLTKTSLSRIERGKQIYTQRTLERIAHALQCTEGDLLMRNPLAESAPWTIWEAVQGLSPDQQQDIARMVKALSVAAKTGTEG